MQTQQNTPLQDQDHDKKAAKKSYVTNKLKKFFHKEKQIAVMELRGVIGNSGPGRQGITIEAVSKLIEEAEKLKSLTALALVINSPGGAPAQTEIISKRLAQFAQKKNIPIFVFIEDIAASGGYWLACLGTKIFTAECSILGSIGVIAASFGFVEAIHKLGIQRRVYTQGENKSILDPFQPEKSEDIAIMHSLQKDIYESFKNYVISRRPQLAYADKSDQEIFTGRVWSGKTAIELGLADEIGEMQEVMRRYYGAEVHFKYLSKDKSKLLKLIGLNSIKNSENDMLGNFFYKITEILGFNRFGL